MSVCLLPLLCVLLAWSAAFPEATMDHTQELDLTATVIINQIAIHQLQEEQRGVQEGVKERENATRRLLDTLDQLECVNKAHQADNLKLEEENTRLNTANHLLEEDNRKTKNEVQLAQEEIVLLKSQIRQVEEDSRLVKEEIRKVEEDSTLVKEEIRKVEEDSRLVKEDNMKTKNEVRLAQEENIQLKSQIRQVEEDSRLVKQEIRQVEEDSRLVKQEIRQVEEDSRLVKQEIRQVEEDSRLVKTRNQQLELAETQAQERVKTALTRIAELERETQQLQEMNNNTAREKGLVQEQLSLLEEQVRVLQTANAALNEEKEETIRKTEEEKRLVEEQLSVSEEEASKLREGNTALQSDKDRQAQQLRSTQEEHEKCKRNVSELYTRVTTAKDCADLYRQGERLDGVYFIKPDREGRPVSAWCDMTTDGGSVGEIGYKKVSFKVMNSNIDEITNRASELAERAQEENPDIIGLTETKLSGVITDAVFPKDYYIEKALSKLRFTPGPIDNTYVLHRALDTPTGGHFLEGPLKKRLSSVMLKNREVAVLSSVKTEKWLSSVMLNREVVVLSSVKTEKWLSSVMLNREVVVLSNVKTEKWLSSVMLKQRSGCSQ
ncbi:putative golgin subfamily A member 6-like protein 19 [Procambarus clarkii]|uniref:putative golgin subfamily A member 6-like protein 19 n=1 Tax=Procambarus clarkii TaxID=6728 RepID=UPI0037447D90